LFLLHICNKCSIKADGEAERYMRNLSPQQFLEYIKDICTAAFLRDICCDANQYMFNYLEPLANARQPAAILSFIDILSSTADNYNMEFFNYI
jgi:hypothetical protein